MTTRFAIVAAALALVACPAAPGNAPILWLAPNGDELHVQLVPIEPNPF